MDKDNSTEILLDLIKTDPDRALRELYDKYYTYVCMVIYKMIGNTGATEEIAQDVFIELWKRKEVLNIKTSLKAYIKRIAVNKTLNHIRANKINFESEDTLLMVSGKEASTQNILEAEDLQTAINIAVETLPEKCRIIFGLSRFEELSYREISEKLGISVKTVENQISKALKVMRMSLKKYSKS